MFIGDGSHVYRENIQMGMQKIKFNDMIHPIALYDETGSCTMSL
jgi:hypothetical protein